MQDVFQVRVLEEEKMATPIVILGAGGFGRHVLSILRTEQLREQYDFLGFVDDGPANHARLDNIAAPLLGTSDVLDTLDSNTRFAIGIGSGAARRALNNKACAAGLKAATVIHPDTSIADDALIGEGTIICAGARITTNVVVGYHAHLNMNVTVGHDVTIGDYATVFPQVALGGEAAIGQGATLGAGSCINPGLRVGERSYIASGAAVIDDVADSSLVAGVPARFKKTID